MGKQNIDKTKMTIQMLRCCLNICMKTIAASSRGTAKKMSVTREITASIQPPRKPAMEPRVAPIKTTQIVVRTPTETEARAP